MEVGVGDLRESGVEDGDVPDEGLTGGVEETTQRMVGTRLLLRPGRGLLLRVAGHDRGVQVEREFGESRTCRVTRSGRSADRPPRPLSRSVARRRVGHLRPTRPPARRRGPAVTGPDQGVGVEACEDPPGGRVRGYRPEQVGLVA